MFLFVEDNRVKLTRRHIEKFIQTVLEVTLSVDLRELKDKEIQPEEWILISNKLKKPVYVLKKVWNVKIYPHCFIEKPYFREVIASTIRRFVISKI